MRLKVFLLGDVESTIQKIINTIGPFVAIHDVNAFRNSFRARCNWAFDVRFLDFDQLPPGTPAVGMVLRIAFRQEFFE